MFKSLCFICVLAHLELAKRGKENSPTEARGGEKEEQGEKEIGWVKYAAGLNEQYCQIDFKNAEWQNYLPNPSGRAKAAPEMEIELQQE